MSERPRRLRLIDLGVIVAILAVALAILMPWAAAIFTVSLLVLCVMVALGRATITELFVASAILLPFFWVLSSAVQAVRDTA